MASKMPKVFYLSLSLVLTILFAFFFGFRQGKSGTSYTATEISVIDAVQKVKPAVVGLETYRGTSDVPLEVGTGIVFRADGFLLTNAHLLRNASRVEVQLANGKRYKAVLVSPADKYDLAVLKIPANHLATAVFGNSDDLKLGQIAIAIGNPLSFGWTVTQGVVSALNRSVTLEYTLYRNLIQTDAAINPGNSGGPLIDTQGRVIGINSLVYENENFTTRGLSFAIPSNLAKEVAFQLVKVGQAPQFKPGVRLGIVMYDLTDQLALQFGLPVVRGIVVESVEPGSPAAKAGLKPGDVLTKMNDQILYNTNSMLNAIRNESPGTVIQLELWRNGIKQTLPVKLEASLP